MIIEESRDQGCIPVLNELFEKYIDLPYYVLPVLASLQLIGIITGVILLIFLAQNEDLAQAQGYKSIGFSILILILILQILKNQY